MSQQVPDPLGSAIQILTTLGAGGIGIKLLERVFASRDKKDDDATSIRKELRDEVATLKERITQLEERYDHERDANATLFAEKEQLRAENHRVRGENHELRSFLTVMVGHAQRLHQTLRLPDAEMPRVPAWLRDSTPGPTTGGQEGAP